MNEWHRTTREDVLSFLKTDPERGLPRAEIQRRLTEYGSNELIERGLKSPIYAGVSG
jgi:magnesium-transporting ATPase (P-type)